MVYMCIFIVCQKENETDGGTNIL